MNRYWKFACPLVVPLIALFLQGYFWDFLKPYVWLSFFPAVFFSVRFSGFWGGLVATLVSVLCVIYFFMPPVWQWSMKDSNSIYSIALFSIMGFLFSLTRLKQKSNELDREKTEFLLRRIR